MRSKKELLELVLDNIDKLGTGLCWLIEIELYYKGLISRQEQNLLLKIFRVNCPISNPYGFYWEIGLKEPRIKFLSELIKKYSN